MALRKSISLTDLRSSANDSYSGINLYLKEANEARIKRNPMIQAEKKQVSTEKNSVATQTVSISTKNVMHSTIFAKNIPVNRVVPMRRENTVKTTSTEIASLRTRGNNNTTGQRLETRTLTEHIARNTRENDSLNAVTIRAVPRVIAGFQQPATSVNRAMMPTRILVERPVRELNTRFERPTSGAHQILTTSTIDTPRATLERRIREAQLYLPAVSAQPSSSIWAKPTPERSSAISWDKLSSSDSFFLFDSAPTNLRSSSVKSSKIISESLGDKCVTSLPGIGQAYGARLKAHGYNKASDLLSKFRSFNQNEAAFAGWLNSVCGANSRWAKASTDCLADYCEQ